jgi:hypothetical protein
LQAAVVSGTSHFRRGRYFEIRVRRMIIVNRKSHVVSYDRRGYESVVLVLMADGKVLDPPGGAEARWAIAADQCLTFRDRSGRLTGDFTRTGPVIAVCYWDGSRRPCDPSSERA